MKESSVSPAESGMCNCGCGQKAPIARHANKRRGHIKGQPVRFIHGHNATRPKTVPPPSTKLCECGCGELAPLAPYTNTKRGLVKGQPLRFVHGHNRRKSDPEYVVDELTGCWVWQLGKTYGEEGNPRYGMRNNVLAHRASYERHKGAIPEGLEIDHLCFNTLCVNPDHLQAVSHEENLRRMREHFREIYGRNPGGQGRLMNDYVRVSLMIQTLNRNEPAA